jgi:2'-5' RNA ligase
VRAKNDGLRWTTPESWHITLQFLGETSPEQFGRLTARLSEVRQGPVAIRLEEPGYLERAGVFHLGVTASEELRQLAERVTASSGLAGFAADKRAYRPHITLARAKGEAGLRALKNRLQRKTKFSGFTADQFLLYESFLDAGGAQYEIRQRFPLSAEPLVTTVH